MTQQTKIYKDLNFFGNKRPLFAIVDQAGVKSKHQALFQRMHDYTFTKTSRCTTYYKNDLKFFDTIDLAMDHANKNNYDVVFIQSVGNFIKYNILLEHLANYYKANPDFYLVAFTLDWEPEKGKGWIECHHQMVFVNVHTWKHVGCPTFGNWETVTEPLPNYSRSIENFHDKYTPYWIKGEPGTAIKTRTSQGWGFIKAGLENGLTIDNFSKEMRECRLYIYPETNSSGLFQSITDKNIERLTNPNQKNWIKSLEKSENNIPIWVFNSENYNFDKKVNCKTYFGPAAGFKYLDILINVDQCKFVFYDYNQLSLDWLEHIKNTWDGKDIISFLNNQEDKFKSKFKYVHGTIEDNANLLYQQFGGETKFTELWQRFKNSDAKFIQCNLFNDAELIHLLNCSDDNNIFFYYSNIFSTDFLFTQHTISEVKENIKIFKTAILDKKPLAIMLGTDEMGRWIWNKPVDN